MIALANKTNVDNTNANYPFGKLINDTGTNNGTPIDEQVYNDMHQFFEKLMFEAGITANNLPDNATNGYQLYNALKVMCNNSWSSSGITYTTHGSATWANVGSPWHDVAYKIDGNEVSLCGAVSISSCPAGFPGIFTLPVAARPSKKVKLIGQYFQTGAAAITTIELELLTNGDLAVNRNLLSGGIAVTVYLDGIRYRKS